MTSKIEQLIDEIEMYIENCKYQVLSNTKISVDKEEMQRLLKELRDETPDEIKRLQKIISNKDAIIAEARKKADALVNEATIQTTQLVSEHQIMQQAYAQADEVVALATKQAQEILDNATMESNNIRASAMQYTDDILANLEGMIAAAIDESAARYNVLLSSLDKYERIVKSNREEMNPPEDLLVGEPEASILDGNGEKE